MVHYKAKEAKIGDLEINLSESAFIPNISKSIDPDLTPEDSKKIEDDLLYYSSK